MSGSAQHPLLNHLVIMHSGPCTPGHHLAPSSRSKCHFLCEDFLTTPQPPTETNHSSHCALTTACIPRLCGLVYNTWFLIPTRHPLHGLLISVFLGQKLLHKHLCLCLWNEIFLWISSPLVWMSQISQDQNIFFGPWKTVTSGWPRFPAKGWVPI